MSGPSGGYEGEGEIGGGGGNSLNCAQMRSGGLATSNSETVGFFSLFFLASFLPSFFSCFNQRVLFLCDGNKLRPVSFPVGGCDDGGRLIFIWVGVRSIGGPMPIMILKVQVRVG